MSVGIWKLLLILIVVLIFFGAGRLPRVMGDLGRGIRSLKEGLKEDEAVTPLAPVDHDKETTP
jgi:sec-independent protein translocase protein TatA